MSWEADEKIKAAKDPNSPLTLEQRKMLLSEATELQRNWGPGGTYRQITTALVAGIGSNVSGGVGEFVQAATVSYLQSLSANKVKVIADEIKSEPARAALHAIVACAGASAQSENCAAGAMGASASSLLGWALGPSDRMTAEEREARLNVVTNLIAGMASIGSKAMTVSNAATLEAENNQVALPLPGPTPPLVFPGNQKIPQGKPPGYVPTVEEQAEASEKGKPIYSGEQGGLIVNEGAGALPTVDDFVRGMLALCKTAVLCNGLNIIAQTSANGDLKYAPTDKHRPAGWGTEMDLDSRTAQNVLNNSIQGGKQRYGVYEGKVYEFQPDNVGGWHGYPIPGNQAPTEVLRAFRDSGVITRSEYNQLIKGR